ncbi:MAG: GAF domain-containing protein [Bryobacteraceae bacterium]|nr:GAF domain-containing protein [Bryobacteraceae bacterium]
MESSAVRGQSALQFLAEASRALAESLDYGRTLETVGQILVPRYAHRFVIDLVADDGKLHRVAMHFQNPEHEKIAKGLPLRYPIDLESSHPIARVLRTSQPLLIRRTPDEMIEELAKDPEQLKIYQMLRGGSSISVPLIARERTIGVLSIGVDYEDAWDESDLLFVKELGGRCAIAIDNARLHRDAVWNARRLKFLADFSTEVGFAVNLDKALAELAQRIVPAFSDQCTIDVYEADGSLRRVGVAFTDPAKAPVAEEIARRFPPQGNPNSLQMQVARSGEARLFSRITDAEIRNIARDEEHAALIRALNCRSGITAPITHRGRILGVLSLGSESPNYFNLADRDFAVDLASRCGSAIENSRLFEETEAARRRLQILYDASGLLSASLDPEETVSSLVNILVPRFADCCMVYLLEDGTLKPARVACSDPGEQAKLEKMHQDHPLDPRAGFGSPKAIRTGKPELVRWMTDEYIDGAGPEPARMTRELGWKSAVFVPLRSRGEVIGALSLLRKASRPPFGEEELELAEELGRRAGPAVDNSRLYASAERERNGARRALQSLQEAERELRQSNDELKQFAFVASHDLREPLRTVSVFSELLQRKFPDADRETNEYLSTIIGGALRMNDLVRDLLAYTRAGEGVILEDMNLAVVVEECLADLKAAIETAGAGFDIEPLPVVRCSRHIALVFQNLISNALKYHGAAPPRVRIWAQAEPGMWRVNVEDNGIGIAPEHRDRIFEVFKRLHGRDVAGTGIGLAICKKIVERCGGSIGVESELGRGSRFWFRIPA